MQELIDSYKSSKNLHHAYFLVGDGEEIFLELRGFLEEKVGVKTLGNPDFWYGKFNTLNIEGARGIAESQERKSFKSHLEARLPSKKIFIIQTDFITEEAQNSLLKVFEEPTKGTHFFIISPQDNLLPTLRSRMQVIMSKMPFDSKSKILNLGIADRLEKVKEITDMIKDENQTKQDAINFLNQIEKELYEEGVEKNHESLKICEQARAGLYDRGAPVKMILENVVLNI